MGEQMVHDFLKEINVKYVSIKLLYQDIDAIQGQFISEVQLVWIFFL